MAGFAPIAWHDFFVGAVSASAALTGLLFVPISINLKQILKFPHLPARAAGTLDILFTALVVSSCGLAPDQSVTALGVEIVLAGAAITFQAVWVSLGSRAADDRTVWKLERLLALLLPGLVFVGGGLSLAVGGGGGLYLVLAAMILAFVVAAINAWVLLIEVLR